MKEILTRRDDMCQDVHTRFTMKYNEDGMIGEFLEEYSIEDLEYLKLRNTYNTYDAVRNNIQIAQKVYVWDEATESWDYSINDVANMYREVKRDDQGRVTLNQMWSNEEKFAPYIGFIFEYGETGSANKMIITSPADEGYLMQSYMFEDLVWHKSDSQYLKMSNNVYHTFTKDPLNQISSYTLYACDANGNKGEWIGSYEAKYDEQDRLVRAYIRMPYDMESYQKYVCEIAYDINGQGSETRLEKNWVDNNDDDIYNLGEELISSVKMTTAFDEKGNPISEEWFNGDVSGQYYQASGMKYETTYTDFDAIEQRITYTFNPNLGEYEYLSKVVYSDFIDVVAGIEDIKTEEGNVIVNGGEITVEGMDGNRYNVFDIQGKMIKSGVVISSKINLEGLAEGIYLVRLTSNDNSLIIKVII